MSNWRHVASLSVQGVWEKGCTMNGSFELIRTPQLSLTIPLAKQLAANNMVVTQALQHLQRQLVREVNAYAIYAAEQHAPALARDADWMRTWLDGEAAAKLRELYIRLEDWTLEPDEAREVADALTGLVEMLNVIRENARLHNESPVGQWLQVMEWVRQIPHSAADILTRRGLPKARTAELPQTRLVGCQDKYLLPTSFLPLLGGPDVTVAA